jgi:hypothetical protein
MASVMIQNICGIERICTAPSELEGSGGGVPRVYTRGYILCLLQRHKNEGWIKNGANRHYAEHLLQ